MVGVIVIGVFVLWFALSVVGVVVAKAPLTRPGFWLRHGVAFGALIALLVIGQLVLQEPSGAAPDDADIVRASIVGVVVLLVAVVLNIAMIYWSAQRLIDIGWSRWWALAVGLLFPIPTIVLGVAPTKPAITERAAVETFD